MRRGGVKKADTGQREGDIVTEGRRPGSVILQPRDIISIMPEYSSSFSSSYSSSRGYSSSSSYTSSYSSSGSRWVPAALGGSYTVEVIKLMQTDICIIFCPVLYLSLNTQ